MPTHYGRNNVQKGRLKVEIDMKFALKSLVAAVAIASIGSAYAAQASGTVGQAVVVKDPGTSGRSVELTLLSGQGGLVFSNGNGDPVNGANPTTSVGGLVGALNVGKVQLSPLDGAQITETILPIGSRVKTNTRAIVRIDATVSKLTADIDGATAGRFTTVNALGGAQQTAAFLDGVLDGGMAKITNLEIDLVNKRVYADVFGDNGFDPVIDTKRLYLWDITNISGPTTITPAALLQAADGDTSGVTALGFKIDGTEAAQAGFGTKYLVSTTNVLSGLKITTEGFNFFSTALGLAPGSTGYNTLNGVNGFAEGWGSLQSKINFSAREVLSTTPVVPEPSTYALMAVGLVGISLVARRRAK
jgi:PEP-CTERM motif